MGTGRGILGKSIGSIAIIEETPGSVKDPERLPKFELGFGASIYRYLYFHVGGTSVIATRCHAPTRSLAISRRSNRLGKGSRASLGTQPLYKCPSGDTHRTGCQQGIRCREEDVNANRMVGIRALRGSLRRDKAMN